MKQGPEVVVAFLLIDRMKEEWNGNKGKSVEWNRNYSHTMESLLGLLLQMMS